MRTPPAEMAPAVASIVAPANRPDGEELAFTPDNCMYCGNSDWEAGFGPKTIVKCSCCLVRCMHVGCAQKAGREMTEAVMEPDAIVTCTKECEQLLELWQKRTGQRLDLEDDPSYSLHVIKYKKDDKVSTSSVDTALKIFRSSFSRLEMDNGRDLLEMVCTGFESPAPPEGQEEDDEEEIYNFGEFRLLVLRKAANIVTVATLRIFGPSFAELPFISTRDGYRREGHCRRLMKAVDRLLQSLGVRWLVVPSMKPVLKMWLHKFNCRVMTEKEQEALLECEIVGMDPETTVLVKRRVGSPFASVSPATSKSVTSSKLTNRGSGRPAGRAPGRPPLSGRGGRGQRGRGGGRGRGRPPRSATTNNESNSDDSSTSSSSSEDDKSDDSDFKADVADHDNGEGDEEQESSSSSEDNVSEDEVTSPSRGGRGAGRGRGRGMGRGRGRGRGRGAAIERPNDQPDKPLVPKPPRKVYLGPPQIGREHLHPSFRKGGEGLAPFSVVQRGVPVTAAEPVSASTIVAGATIATKIADQGTDASSTMPPGTIAPGQGTSAAGADAGQPGAAAAAASTGAGAGRSQSSGGAPSKPPICPSASTASKRPATASGGKRTLTQQQQGANKKPRKAAARPKSAEAKRALLVKQKLAVLSRLKEQEALLRAVEAAEMTVRVQLGKDELLQQLLAALKREQARTQAQAQQLQAQASHIHQQAAMLQAAGIVPPEPPTATFSQLPIHRHAVVPAPAFSIMQPSTTAAVAGRTSLGLPNDTNTATGPIAQMSEHHRPAAASFEAVSSCVDHPAGQAGRSSVHTGQQLAAASGDHLSLSECDGHSRLCMPQVRQTGLALQHRPHHITAAAKEPATSAVMGQGDMEIDDPSMLCGTDDQMLHGSHTAAVAAAALISHSGVNMDITVPSIAQLEGTAGNVTDASSCPSSDAAKDGAHLVSSGAVHAAAVDETAAAAATDASTPVVAGCVATAGPAAVVLSSAPADNETSFLHQQDAAEMNVAANVAANVVGMEDASELDGLLATGSPVTGLHIAAGGAMVSSMYDEMLAAHASAATPLPLADRDRLASSAKVCSDKLQGSGQDRDTPMPSTEAVISTVYTPTAVTPAAEATTPACVAVSMSGVQTDSARHTPSTALQEATCTTPALTRAPAPTPEPTLEPVRLTTPIPAPALIPVPTCTAAPTHAAKAAAVTASVTAGPHLPSAAVMRPPAVHDVARQALLDSSDATMPAPGDTTTPVATGEDCQGTTSTGLSQPADNTAAVCLTGHVKDQLKAQEASMKYSPHAVQPEDRVETVILEHSLPCKDVVANMQPVSSNSGNEDMWTPSTGLAAATAANAMSALPPAIPGPSKLPSVGASSSVTGLNGPSFADHPSPVLMASPRSRDSFHHKLTQQLLPQVLGSWLESPSRSLTGSGKALSDTVVADAGRPASCGDDASGEDGACVPAVAATTPDSSNLKVVVTALASEAGQVEDQRVAHGTSQPTAAPHSTDVDGMHSPPSVGKQVQSKQHDASTERLLKLCEVACTSAPDAKLPHQPGSRAAGRASGTSLLSNRALRTHGLVDAIFGSTVPSASCFRVDSTSLAAFEPGSPRSPQFNSAGGIAASRAASAYTASDKRPLATAKVSSEEQQGLESNGSIRASIANSKRARLVSGLKPIAELTTSIARPAAGMGTAIPAQRLVGAANGAPSAVCRPARSTPAEICHASHVDHAVATSPQNSLFSTSSAPAALVTVDNAAAAAAAASLDSKTALPLVEHLFATGMGHNSVTPTKVSAGEAGLLVPSSPASTPAEIIAHKPGLSHGRGADTVADEAPCQGEHGAGMLQYTSSGGVCTAFDRPTKGALSSQLSKPVVSTRPALLASLTSTAKALLGRKRTGTGHIVPSSVNQIGTADEKDCSQTKPLSMSEVWAGRILNVVGSQLAPTSMAVQHQPGHTSPMHPYKTDDDQSLPRGLQVRSGTSTCGNTEALATSSHTAYMPTVHAGHTHRLGSSLLGSRTMDSGRTILDQAMAESEDDSVGAMRVAAKFCWQASSH